MDCDRREKVDIAGRVLLICSSCVKDQGSGQGRKAVKGVKWREVCRSLLSPIANIIRTYITPHSSGDIHSMAARLYLVTLNISKCICI